ncbi:hypothetical protein MNB_SV-5-62 [hydrothermal vent metagenome]|uniref:Uncharacterized protein n=1 Tax=hydrothermal vent metagenome TaxID=652676 RepID=A0A1W1ECB0_9ZZZZ
MEAAYKKGESVLHGTIEDICFIEPSKSYQYKINNGWYHETAISPKLRKYEYYQRLILKSTFTKKRKIGSAFYGAGLTRTL